MCDDSLKDNKRQIVFAKESSKDYQKPCKKRIALRKRMLRAEQIKMQSADWDALS